MGFRYGSWEGDFVSRAGGPRAATMPIPEGGKSRKACVWKEAEVGERMWVEERAGLTGLKEDKGPWAEDGVQVASES